MNFKKIKKLDEAYILHTYKRANVVFKKGKGARIWDTEGREYIDFGAGIGVNVLGHSNKTIKKALSKSLDLLHTSNLYYIASQAQCAKEIIELYKSGSDIKDNFRIFFSNSGAEANECAIKIARKWGETQNRYKIISLDSSFHGRTMATLKMSAQDKMHKHFAPHLDGFVYAKDLMDIRRVIDKQTCAVILELIHGEGGLKAWDKEEVIKLEKYVKKQGILLIIDEVQSGIYRSGEIFASKVYKINPDIITTAKGLAGGVPIGACISKLVSIYEPGDHGSTFGGNPLSTTTALGVLSELSRLKTSGKLDKTITYFECKLESICERYPNIFNSISGLGLMRGLKLKNANLQAKIIELALKERLLILRSGSDVIRFLPSLNIKNSEVDEGFKRFEKALQALDS